MRRKHIVPRLSKIACDASFSITRASLLHV
jgi:hypothetical protein